MKAPRLPNNSQRTVCVGRTGSGKTVSLVWLLSTQRLNKEPWILFNFKNDEILDNIPNARHVDYDFIPSRKDTGIYIIHPLPSDARPAIRGEQSPLEQYLWKLWSRENVGIFCDEGYMMGDNAAFEACLTQGRSKHIPMLIGAQRPAWLSRFCFSEADFFQVFHLNDERDKKTIESFVPLDYSSEDQLEEFQSYYYDVGKNKVWKFNPVPKPEESYSAIESKTMKRRGWL